MVNASQYVADLFWLVPELWLALVGFVLLAVAPFTRDVASDRRLAWISVIGQGVALALLFVLYGGLGGVFGPGSADSPGAVFRLASGNPLLLVDGFSIVLKATILAAGIVSTLMGIRFLEIERMQRPEFHAVLVFAVVGAMFLVSSTDFITLFTGLETMSLSVYLLVGWSTRERKSNEAALKYFLLGSLASGFLLYGMSLMYGATGSTNLFAIAGSLRGALRAGGTELVPLGIMFLIVGVGFKMAAAPFHVWTPDAYEGAPTLVTAFMSTAVKTAAFGMGLRIFLLGLPATGAAEQWTLLFAIMAAISMTLGNTVAILQDNMKRLLAYSSIAHAGYALLGLVAVGAALSGRLPAGMREQAISYGQFSVVLYMVAYTFTNLGAFALVAMLRREGMAGDRVEDFAGMARRAPWLAAAMTVFLLSLAGIPATAGFIGKWWLFASAIEGGFGWLAVVAAVNTAISLYYYVRVIVKMYMDVPGDALAYSLTPAVTAAIVIALAGTLIIGLWPDPVFRLVEGTVQLVP
ncbi:MAG: NADH-quinone oxidoreductase subunit N [Acidobacteria bacterium]|nr:NADH-quinone oxidoreductase subunit N [Acidobacteriota bacterium]